MNFSNAQWQQAGQQVIEIEAQAILNLRQRVDANFVTACQLLLACKGRIVVTGVGKSGHIARKVAATLASTGSPAFFVHAGEASHGDLGMMTCQDVALVFSNSGETQEVLAILPLIKRLGLPLVALTGHAHSTLAQFANAHLDVSVAQEACPLGLAPTSSTTAALVMGDALAIALLKARGVTSDDFALSHPGGQLGKRLLLSVEDVMHTGNDMPCVLEKASLAEAILEMTAKKLGMTAVVNSQGRLVGIFTDGDLRRLLSQQMTLPDCTVGEVMTRQCISVNAQCLAAQAMQVMQTKKINALCVINEAQHLQGALNMHDLIRAGIV